MKRIRVADLAERDLDEIWAYVAKQSQSIEIADSVIESLTTPFYSLHIPLRQEPAAMRSNSASGGFRPVSMSSITAKPTSTSLSPE
jgi:plasmid stabilization system protein ParE